MTESKKAVDVMVNRFENCYKQVEKLEFIVYKKESDMPNIFDDLENRIIDVVSCKFKIYRRVKAN